MDSKDHFTELFQAIKLLDSLRDNRTSSLESVLQTYIEGESVLTFFISRSNGYPILQLYKCLLELDVNPNTPNAKGETPLILICRNRNIDARLQIAQLLLEHGADPNDQTPLHALFQSIVDLPLVQLLLKHGADPNRLDHENNSVLIKVIESNCAQKEDLEKLLIEHGADVNQRCGNWNPLSMAIRYSSKVKILLESGADPNVGKLNGDPPLHLARQWNREVISDLLAFGADPNTKGTYSGTILSDLCNGCNHDENIQYVQLLLDYQAQVNLTSGLTPLRLACNYYNPKTINLLLLSGATVPSDILCQFFECHKYNDYNDPYRESEAVNKIVGSLLRYGADPNAESNNKSVWDWAQRYKKNGYLITILLDHGMKPDPFFLENIGKKKRKYEVYHQILHEAARVNFQKVVKEIPVRANEMLYQPDSIRSQILACSWNNYESMRKVYPNIMELLNIQNEKEYEERVQNQVDHLQ